MGQRKLVKLSPSMDASTSSVPRQTAQDLDVVVEEEEDLHHSIQKKKSAVIARCKEVDS